MISNESLYDGIPKFETRRSSRRMRLVDRDILSRGVRGGGQEEKDWLKTAHTSKDKINSQIQLLFYI